MIGQSVVLRLIVDREAYELGTDEGLLTRLDGGAETLIGGPGEQLHELAIETAIERAEDWIMPFSKSLHGLQLEVLDRTGRLRAYHGETWALDQVEREFTRLYDVAAHRQAMDKKIAADIVLLRELAHHGRLSGIRVCDPDVKRW